MELEELKRKLEKSLFDIKEKMNEIDALLHKQDAPMESLKDAHSQLKTLHDEIIQQYNQIDAMEAEDEEKVDEIEEDIYSSLESFNAIYRKAGALFEKNEFFHRDHYTDYNNPIDTR